MGGKTFIKDGFNPASRIDTLDVSDIFEVLEESIGHFFHDFCLAEDENYIASVKDDVGDIDIIVRPLEFSVRKEIRDLFESQHMLTKMNGPFEHILFPYKGKHYQIDLIYCKDKKEFQGHKFFYSRPTTFNALIGHFARSLGYKFSTEGLKIRVTNKQGQVKYITICTDPERSLKILGYDGIPDSTELYESPEAFAKWIQSSPRFDSRLFSAGHNKQSHRDSSTDDFCQKAYLILDNYEIVSDLVRPHINYQTDENIVLKDALDFEWKYIYWGEAKNVEEYGKEKVKTEEKYLISGKALIRWGYATGPIFATIQKDVTARFTEATKIPIIKSYIENKYRLVIYGSKQIDKV